MSPSCRKAACKLHKTRENVRERVTLFICCVFTLIGLFCFTLIVFDCLSLRARSGELRAASGQTYPAVEGRPIWSYADLTVCKKPTNLICDKWSAARWVVQITIFKHLFSFIQGYTSRVWATQKQRKRSFFLFFRLDLLLILRTVTSVKLPSKTTSAYFSFNVETYFFRQVPMLWRGASQSAKKWRLSLQHWWHR